MEEMAAGSGVPTAAATVARLDRSCWWRPMGSSMCPPAGWEPEGPTVARTSWSSGSDECKCVCVCVCGFVMSEERRKTDTLSKNAHQ